MIISGAGSTKELIIGILGRRWPISMKKIFFIVNKTTGRSITYQAVHKAMKELRCQNIVEKTEDGYRLNMEWILSIKLFAEHLYADYTNEINRDICSVDSSINIAPTGAQNQFLHKPVFLKTSSI